MSVQFRVRDFNYPLSIWRLHRQFERSQWWSLDELLEYQSGLLRDTIAHAYQAVPHYHELFRRSRLTPADFKSADDLPKLPTLSKATLRAECRRLQASDADRYRPRIQQTSGTSGEPVRFLLDKPANVLEFVHYWRHWSWAGYSLGARFAELSSHHFMQNDALSRQAWCYQAALGRLLLNSMVISPDGAVECVKAIRRHRSLFLKGLASVLSVFALFVKRAGIVDLTFQGIFSTGEVLLTPQRTLIEQVFHSKVYDSYGHMERTVAVSECADGSLHVNPEYGVLELVDKKLMQPTAQHRDARVLNAAVVGTSLHNRSMPLLRYEVGDVIQFEEPAQPCPCGRAMPRVRCIEGRREDIITRPDGRVVTTLFLVFNQVTGVALGQAVQDAPDRLAVRIVRAPEYTAQSEADLLGLLRRFVGESMRIDLEYVPAAVLHGGTTGKFRAVRSLVPTPFPAIASASSVNP
jgi:phenylacetate-coenzyme A ligase PaaK-like adenylate-forming protein